MLQIVRMEEKTLFDMVNREYREPARCPDGARVRVEIGRARRRSILAKRTQVAEAQQGLAGGGKLWRRKHAHLRRRRVPALDLDQGSQRARALRQRRGADVEGEHV